MDDEGNVQHNVPYKDWLPTLRFPRVQEKADTSYEVRPIDDCTGSGLNDTTSTVDTMVLDNLMNLKKAALHIPKLWGKPQTPKTDRGGPALGLPPKYKPTWAKGDHEKAYRNLPVHPDAQPLLATLVWDKEQ